MANGEDLAVKYKIDNKLKQSLLNTDVFTKNKTRIIKINDHGKPNINNIDITDIQVNKWKDYKYKPNKQ